MNNPMNNVRPADAYVEQRFRRWLENELELDEDPIEMILHLRRQVLALQAQLGEMEVELSGHRAGQQTRLVQYQETIYEAEWEELTGE
jgi:hypothetical protein